MPAMPLSWNLRQLKGWAEKSGIPFWATPQAKNTVPYDGRSECKRCNTCEICPTGARYSPDETFRRLLAKKAIALHDRTLVRRLVPATDGGKTPRIAAAQAVHRDQAAGSGRIPRAALRPRRRLLLESSPAAVVVVEPLSRTGWPISSGTVGRYMNGHAFMTAQIELDAEIYPGMNDQHSLISRQFFRCASRQALRPPRPARLGEHGRARTAAERRGRPRAAR